MDGVQDRLGWASVGAYGMFTAYRDRRDQVKKLPSWSVPKSGLSCTHEMIFGFIYTCSHEEPLLPCQYPRSFVLFFYKPSRAVCYFSCQKASQTPLPFSLDSVPQATPQQPTSFDAGLCSGAPESRMGMFLCSIFGITSRLSTPGS